MKCVWESLAGCYSNLGYAPDDQSAMLLFGG